MFVAKFATIHRAAGLIFVVCSFIDMRPLPYISLCLLLALAACTSPPREEIGLMSIRCVGLPAMQGWVQDHVEDETRRQTGRSVRSLPAIHPRSNGIHCLRPVCMHQAGQMAGVDMVLGGSIERLADRLLIGWRMVDLRNEDVDWFAVQDQPYLPERLETMIRASLREFLATAQQGGKLEESWAEPKPVPIEHIE